METPGAANTRGELANTRNEHAQDIAIYAPAQAVSTILAGDCRQVEQFLAETTTNVSDGPGLCTLSAFADGEPAKNEHFAPGQPAAMAARAIKWNAEGYNVYYNAALRREGLANGKRGTIDDLLGVFAVVVDLDAADAASRWRERTRELALAEPSFVVQTSTGRFQLVYVLKELITDIAVFRNVAGKLRHAFGADACTIDVAHAWRLPGTVNYPNEKKASAGRVQELATLAGASGHHFTPLDFDHLPDPPGDTAPVTAATMTLDLAPSRQWGDPGYICGELPTWMQTQMMQNEPPIEDRSSFDWQVYREGRKAGMNFGDMVALYRWGAALNLQFTDKVREEARRGGAAAALEYLARPWRKAEPTATKDGTRDVPVITSVTLASGTSSVAVTGFDWRTRGITAAALDKLTLPEPRYSVRGLLAEGAAILAGRPKHGKSWLALAIGHAVATGEPVLGHFDTDAGDVLYIASEDTPRRLKSRMAMMLGNQPRSERLHLHTEWPRAHEGGLEALDDWLTAHSDARLVLIDTLAKFRKPGRRNGNPYEDDYEALAQVKAIADKHGATVLAITHARKAKSESGDPFDEITGTMGIMGAADTLLYLKRERTKADGELIVTGRDVDEAEYALSFDKATGTWTYMGAAEEHRHTGAKAEVLSLIQLNGPMTPAAISRGIHMPAGTIRSALNRLKKEGALVEKNGAYDLP
jgi:hypothetical protein